MVIFSKYKMKKITLIVFGVLCCFVGKTQNEKHWINIKDENTVLLSNIHLLYIDSGKILKMETVNNGFIMENQNFEYLIVAHNYRQTKIVVPKQLLKIDEIVLQSNSKNSTENSEIYTEEIAYIDSLPKDYKMIEVKAVNATTYRTSGLNVRKSSVEKDYVDEEKIKQNFTQEEKTTGNFNYVKNSNIYYSPQAYKLHNEAKDVLKAVATALKNGNSLSLTLTAYADTKEELNTGKEIAKKRAEEITSFLMKEGVDFGKIKVVAIGNDILQNNCHKATNCTDQQHQENRKVEMVFAYE